ncbi:tetratricopeptide repeat protein [Streptomyces calidiresistens]|uniref:Tetratricopeptide repeat protein n=1 Tax=Streptomyces calidiresistens TaxID=1485586 RepID=A0A7W3XVG0_9ACTN|nr:tetratricopeptide repeat protein [Streptomyces calidiresistens]MBB0228773.1 tetratricopeptide repeat protein [Streptomyces calidiresistens]
MTTIAPEWEQRVAALWDAFDDHEEAEFRSLMEKLAAELPEDHAVGLFERASACDSTGLGEEAIGLYRRALGIGLTGERRRRAVVQLASSLRALGHAREAVDLLTAERKRVSDHLDDSVAAFLALALADVGREREAVALSLTTLAPHLPRYTHSVNAYAQEMTEPDGTSG